MPQPPLDDDVADFLDDAHWTPRPAVAVSVLNRWARWCADTTPPCGRRPPRPRGYLDDRADRRHRPGHPPQGLADHHRRSTTGRPARAGPATATTAPAAACSATTRCSAIQSPPRRRSRRRPGPPNPTRSTALLDALRRRRSGPAQPGDGVADVAVRDARRGAAGIDLADLVDWGTTGRQSSCWRRRHQDRQAPPGAGAPRNPTTARPLPAQTGCGCPARCSWAAPATPATATAASPTPVRADGQTRRRANGRVPVSSHQLRRGFVSQYLRAAAATSSAWRSSAGGPTTGCRARTGRRGSRSRHRPFFDVVDEPDSGPPPRLTADVRVD